MDPQSMAVRVGRLKRKINGFMASSDYRLTLEPVSTQTIRHLRALDQYPPDILMLLEQIGCVRNLGYNDHALIDWWTPCTIDHALVEDRCRFQLSNSDFKTASNLLFFAYDCDANCYFYDTSRTPWKLVVCDGLLDSRNQVQPCEKPGLLDALSAIERWLL